MIFVKNAKSRVSSRGVGNRESGVGNVFAPFPTHDFPVWKSLIDEEFLT
jgi:hypothetical protein